VIVPRRASSIPAAAIVILAIAVLYLARDVFIPLAFAIVLSLILAPAVGWLQRLRMRRFVASLLVMLLSLTAAGVVGYVIFQQLVQVVNELPTYRDNINHKIQAVTGPGKGVFGQAAQSVKQLEKELVPPPDQPVPAAPPGRVGSTNAPAKPVPVQVVEAPANVLVYLREVAQPFLRPLALLGIVLVFTIFLLVEEADVRNRIFRLAGLNRLNVMTQALEDATQRVSRYLMLQFLVNATFGVVFGVGVYLIGLPYAALWGTVTALFRIVPYIGSFTAGLLPVLLSLAVFDSWKPPLLVFLLFMTLEVVTANWLEPWLYGAHTGVSSLALLLTTVFWAMLWGPAGLILSTPLTVCVVVLGRYVPHLEFLHILLGDQPVLSPQAHYYQRLLAMDDQEAREVAEEYRKSNSLLQLYDAVLLPALILAEQDRHKGALDRTREEFLFLSVREMLAEFSEKEQISATEEFREAPQPTFEGRVLCFAAHDEADEIASAMLTQLLESAGYATVSLSGPTFQAMLAQVEPAANDVFCISSVPPFAFTHARTLNRQLRAKFPRAKILVGVWGFSGEMERAVQRFQPTPPDKLVSSLADAMEYLGIPKPAPPLTPGEKEEQAEVTLTA
jgi:predicted PurR-regulated permease PerM/methanogenic corrinoid protein MtbC1